MVVEETVIEEPVNILEEPEHLSDPPLRSYSIDEEISIPSPTIATPPVAAGASSSSTTPVPTPTTSTLPDLPCSTPPITPTLLQMTSSDRNNTSSSMAENNIISATASVNSPASVRSTRGNSITFSSSRSPSPAYSNPLSMASTIEDIAETESIKSGSGIGTGNNDNNKNNSTSTNVVLDIDPSILPKTLKAKTNPPNPQRQNPTAIVNKTRPPKGDVNLERSLEIVRSAVEKSSTQAAAMQQQQPPPQQVQQQQQQQQQPMVIPVRPSIRPAGGGTTTTMPNAVLVTTSDGKTLLAHPTGQILQNIRPGQTLSPVSPSPLRLRLPNKPSPQPAITTGGGGEQPQPQVVRVLQQTAPVTTRPTTTVFRMPTSSASGGQTVVLDANQLNNLIVS